MAANCEPCLNQIVPNLVEAGVPDTDIRRAVEIGQTVKDQSASRMKDAADILAGTRLLNSAIREGCATDGIRPASSCCA